MKLHELAILDHTGHSVTKWDPAKPDDVQQARDVFDALIGAGKQVFAVEGEDRQGRRLTTFDPSVARMMVVPQLRGG